MIVTEILRLPDNLSAMPVPLIMSRVSAGFPSPAEGYEDGKLDLNEYLIANKAATFLIRAEGDSMRDAGILDGDLLVVDRSIQPKSGDVVIAAIGGEFLVKRIRMESGSILLEAANEGYPTIEISSPEDFEVWGVVTSAVHRLRK